MLCTQVDWDALAVVVFVEHTWWWGIQVCACVSTRFYHNDRPTVFPDGCNRKGHYPSLFKPVRGVDMETVTSYKTVSRPQLLYRTTAKIWHAHSTHTHTHCVCACVCVCVRVCLSSGCLGQTLLLLLLRHLLPLLTLWKCLFILNQLPLIIMVRSSRLTTMSILWPFWCVSVIIPLTPSPLPPRTILYSSHLLTVCRIDWRVPWQQFSGATGLVGFSPFFFFFFFLLCTFEVVLKVSVVFC